MKLFKKLVVMLVLVFSLVVLVGCGSTEDDGKHEPINKDEQIKIGILQIATHGALDAAREGFINELKTAGYDDGEEIKIIYKNPEGDSSNLTLMAKDLVRECDLVLAIATDAAKAIKTACENEDIKIPVLFTAVTDAVDAKLVKSNDEVGGRITGTSDMNPVNEQIELVKELNGDIKKLGILYTISETNSQVQANMAQAKAEAEGLTVKVGTVTGTSDIIQVTRQLITDGAEIIYVPTDNNLAKNMGAVAQVANELKVPVICGEENMVKAGGLITLGINYEKLGKLTGQMAVEIINGKQASELKVQSLSLEECDLVVNTDTATKINFTVPSEILEKAKKVTNE